MEVNIEIVSGKKTVKFQDIPYLGYFEYQGSYYALTSPTPSTLAALNLQTNKEEFGFWDKDVIPLKLEKVEYKFSIR